MIKLDQGGKKLLDSVQALHLISCMKFITLVYKALKNGSVCLCSTFLHISSNECIEHFSGFSLHSLLSLINWILELKKNCTFVKCYPSVSKAHEPPSLLEVLFDLHSLCKDFIFSLSCSYVASVYFLLSVVYVFMILLAPTSWIQPVW